MLSAKHSTSKHSTWKPFVLKLGSVFAFRQLLRPGCKFVTNHCPPRRTSQDQWTRTSSRRVRARPLGAWTESLGKNRMTRSTCLDSENFFNFVSPLYIHFWDFFSFQDKIRKFSARALPGPKFLCRVSAGNFWFSAGSYGIFFSEQKELKIVPKSNSGWQRTAKSKSKWFGGENSFFDEKSQFLRTLAFMTWYFGMRDIQTHAPVQKSILYRLRPLPLWWEAIRGRSGSSIFLPQK